MSHSRKTGKDEHIAHLAITVEREFVVHQRLQLGFDQITSLFGRFLRMIVGKGIPGDNAGVVGFRHDRFQRLCVDADARRGKPFLTEYPPDAVSRKGTRLTVYARCRICGKWTVPGLRRRAV